VQRWVQHGVPNTRPKLAVPHLRLGRKVRFREEDVEYLLNALIQARILPAKRGPRKGAA
jgi:hypothetical protein